MLPGVMVACTVPLRLIDKEGCGVLPHQAVQRGLLGAVAFVVDRGAIGRPAGLLHRGLHALLMSRLWCFTARVSS